jgi:hypothetical protein
MWVGQWVRHISGVTKHLLLPSHWLWHCVTYILIALTCGSLYRDLQAKLSRICLEPADRYWNVQALRCGIPQLLDVQIQQTNSEICSSP